MAASHRNIAIMPPTLVLRSRNMKAEAMKEAQSTEFVNFQQEHDLHAPKGNWGSFCRAIQDVETTNAIFSSKSQPW